jgi:hypothetical protein
MKIIGEAFTIVCLLFVNVVMGNFSQSALADHPDWTAWDRVVDAFSIQNAGIAVFAGLTFSFFLWHVIRK